MAGYPWFCVVAADRGGRNTRKNSETINFLRGSHYGSGVFVQKLVLCKTSVLLQKIARLTQKVIFSINRGLFHKKAGITLIP
jgi:hypothetical protein